MDFVRVNGVTLHYRIDGSAQGTPLVLVNSLGTDLRMWDGVVPAFAGDFRVVRHDKRGHGLSDCPPAPYTIRDHADDLAGLLDELGVSRFVLVGISVGGMIALDFAARHPARVRLLVLCDTAAKIGTAEGWNARITAVREQGMESLSETVVTRWFAPSFGETCPAVYTGCRNMLARIPAEGYIGTCAALRDGDLTEAARAVRAKTLVVCGAEDAATPPGVVRGLLDQLPDSRYAEIPEAGHLPCVEQPDQFAEVVKQFFRENADAG